MDKKQKFIEELFEKGILASKDLLEGDQLDEKLIDKIEAEGDLVVLNSDYSNIIANQSSLVDWYEVDKIKVQSQIDRDDELYQSQLQKISSSDLSINNNQTQKITTPIVTLKDNQININLENNPVSTTNSQLENNLPDKEKINIQNPNKVKIIISYQNTPQKHQLKDFTNIFLSRYYYLESLLRGRTELRGTLSISRALIKKDNEECSIIGLIDEIATTRNGNYIITMEDITGKMKILVTKKNKELFELASDLVLDEVIGISGNCGDKIIFAKNIVWPDIPRSNILKKSPTEEYAVFLSDIHVGSNLFLEEEFIKFISWLKGDFGSPKHKEIASKVKYVFIAGDLVDGIGIYASQQEELAIDNIKGQYDHFSNLIKEIPKDKQIIMCPGNHDAVHLAEPQTQFYKEYASSIFELENATIVTNPAVVNIGKTDSFEGLNVLMYHGYSFDYYVANVPSIRLGGGYHRADLIMKFLLKRRHLAPTYKSTPYYPSHKIDPFLIKQIPDFFVTGHIHYSCVANYRGVTMISGSCWQDKTDFQEKLGHEPEPGRVPVVNLKTREVKVLRFK
jgi:DNA polymerase II small subunit